MLTNFHTFLWADFEGNIIYKSHENLHVTYRCWVVLVLECESLCVVMVLIQHITPRVPSTLTQELYVFGAAGLQQQFVVRACVADTDMAGVGQLVHSLHLGDVLLTDVQQYVNAHRDQVNEDLTTSPFSNVSPL